MPTVSSFARPRYNQAMSDRPVRLKRADEIMSRRVITTEGGATVAEAVRLMRQEKVTALVVERRGPEDAWGIITRADVIYKVVATGLDPATTLVHEVMTKPIVTVSPGLAIKFCLRLMQMGGVRRAAVFDGENLIGVLAHGDIVRALDL
jgi:CBS domain-containing protein